MSTVRYLIGQITERSAVNKNFLKVVFQQMKLDENLLMYFPEQTEKWAVDNNCKSQIGDVVLVKDLPEKITLDVKSEVQSIVYKQGAIRDSLTGRLCRGTEFLDEKERAKEILRRDVEELKIKQTKLVRQSDLETQNK